MKKKDNANPLATVNTTVYIDHAAFLSTINPDTNKIPNQLFQRYLNIYNNYCKAPWMPDRTEANPNERNQDDARYGCRCCHLFFFQAEDGIRDYKVTGVQTCALPISEGRAGPLRFRGGDSTHAVSPLGGPLPRGTRRVRRALHRPARALVREPGRGV